ncbi:resistance to Congo red protein [Micromonospora sp. LOL_024]|uniref:resistance to Congo red protein n=1 Tax=Micromonospora sp. LOL_024 TaxID=3345412 RepID=UPI003A8C6517
MRIIAFLAVFIIVLTAVLLVFVAMTASARRRRQTSQLSARWAVRHYAIPGRGHTVVGVTLADADGRVHGEHVVARIPDDAQDWQRDFIVARQEAEERAFHLNADRPSIEG